jgi:disulfide oxidoreductase YuzD
MEHIKQQAIKTALKQMFSNQSFSICTIDDLIKLTNVVPDAKVYRIMHTQHCIKYSEMPKELREWLYLESVKMFAGEGFDLSIIDAVFDRDSNVKIIRLDSPEQTKKQNFIQRLLS